MYYFELFDAVMFGIMMVLLIAFAVSVTHATMKTKMEVVLSHNESVNNALRDSNAYLLKEWSEASVYMYAVHDAATVNWCLDPTKNAHDQLIDLIRTCENMALDPAISLGAQSLINKAKREHGKKIRKAADRKLERVEREYEARIASLRITAETQQRSREHFAHENQTLRSDIGVIRAELSAFQSIVGQELENFVRLPSVRNKMLAAINQQHKAWKEL